MSHAWCRDDGRSLARRGIVILAVALFSAAAPARTCPQFGLFVKDGGLMVHGADLLDVFRCGADNVDKLLKGAQPSDIPVEQPTKVGLVVNLKAAKAPGLALPQAVLVRADEVIR